ncbi:hypothetical protein [Pseudarthrobacter sp. H2]|uniref:hypothetical protein n=1 Tax=Pseudarthrobacter sp. H2 TaxID=3418415 RepID=UPI003CEF13FA
MINPEANADWPGRLPPEVEAFIRETVEMIHELDDTGLQEMTPLFYQHGYEQVRMSLQNLLKILGHDPDA